MNEATSKWAIVGDTVIAVTGPGIVADAHFQRFLAELRKEPVKKYLGATLGKPEATSLQRKQISDILKTRAIRTAAVTDDAITRGVVTAISWLGANIKAFAWSDTNSALKYLEVEEPWASKAVETLARLRAEVEVTVVR